MRNKQVDLVKRDNLVVDTIFKHKGRENPISAIKLREILLDNGYKVNVINIGSLVNKIKFERKLPICFVNSKGYFWATNKQEIALTIKDLKGRALKMLEHAEFLQSFIID